MLREPDIKANKKADWKIQCIKTNTKATRMAQATNTT